MADVHHETVFFTGHVQGVGFRYTVRHIAKGFDVAGWVKNLDDGRVEMQASGEDEEVRGFLKAIQDSELGSLIKKTDEHEIAPPADAKGFSIQF